MKNELTTTESEKGLQEVETQSAKVHRLVIDGEGPMDRTTPKLEINNVYNGMLETNIINSTESATEMLLQRCIPEIKKVKFKFSQILAIISLFISGILKIYFGDKFDGFNPILIASNSATLCYMVMETNSNFKDWLLDKDAPDKQNIIKTTMKGFTKFKR